MTTLLRARIAAVDNGFITQAPVTAAPPLAASLPNPSATTVMLVPAGSNMQLMFAGDGRPVSGEGPFLVMNPGSGGDGGPTDPPRGSHDGVVPPPTILPWALHERVHLTVDTAMEVVRGAMTLRNINWGQASRTLREYTEQMVPSLVVASLDDGFMLIETDPREVMPPGGVVMVSPPGAEEREIWREDSPTARHAPRRPRPVKRFVYEKEANLMSAVHQWLVDHVSWAEEHDHAIR